MKKLISCLVFVSVLAGVSGQKSYNIGTSHYGSVLERGSSEMGDWEVFLIKTNSDFISFSLKCNDSVEGFGRVGLSVSRYYYGDKEDLSLHISIGDVKKIQKGDITAIAIKSGEEYIHPIEFVDTSSDQPDKYGFYSYGLMFDIDDELLRIMGRTERMLLIFFVKESGILHEISIPKSFINALTSF